MPKRTDIHTILIIGSGPIVIGQGCEFDYSGTQACKALRAEGYRVVLVNSNPATIMTDPEFSDRTYIEPITPEGVRKVIEKQREIGDPIDAVLPTLGGQTALNCACALWDDGTFEKFGIRMIGADRAAIHRAEDRQEFKELCEGIGLKMAKAKTVKTLEDARAFIEEIGLPAIIRPAFTLGGSGGGVAYNTEEFDEIVQRGLRMSMIGQILIDQSLLGWKEYELEVIRDKKDNCIVVCGIENIDPMGVHTGDSITIAPILTLTDKEYQAMRDAAFAIMRKVGVETGGSNVQFAVNPDPKPGPDGKKPFEMVVIEMNPRVSRSSALASKATGFPIAKIAAKLAVGYTLDELKNDITGTTSACFEPTIDYIVTKMPRWTFEKFPEADETLTTQMKSVGEAMAIGRTFTESLQKAIRSMEVKRFGLGLDRQDVWLDWKRSGEVAKWQSGKVGEPSSSSHSATLPLSHSATSPIEWPIEEEKLTRKLAVPSQGRLYYIRYAMKMGWSDERIYQLCKIDHFFLDQIRRLVEFEDVLCKYGALEEVPREVLFEAKQLGYSDAQLANLYLGNISTETILKVRAHRKGQGIEPVYKLVDTCAAEFEAKTPYYYSTYESGATGSRGPGLRPGQPTSGAPQSGPEARSTAGSADDEIRVTDKRKVIILGGGPNRIGQGIEFDYCCVHAAFAAKELGFEAVMINSNPETVSTDYDTSDLLFFEPLTLEDVLNVVERLGGDAGKETSLARRARSRRVHGLIVQFGGQTPLNLARGLQQAGAPIIGTSVDSIDAAEDRDRFDVLLDKLKLQKPPSGIARTLEKAVEIAGRIGYPVLVRPSYVLGGRGMEICPDEKALRHYMATAVNISELDNAPVLIDKFLDDATEVDVDVVADFQGGPALRAGSDASQNESQSSILQYLLDRRQRGIVPRTFLPRDPFPEGMYGAVSDLKLSRRDLPHLELPGATYFVTWRADVGVRMTEQERAIALDALRHFDGDRCEVYVANVMPDHVHWIVRPFEGHDLGSLVASVKRFSARQINELRGSKGSLWEADKFDHIVRDGGWFNKFLWYVLENPVEAGLVQNIADYAWTWASPVLAEEQGKRPGSESRATLEGQALVCGVLEHIEQAGIHSGDSACTIPAWSLSKKTVERIKEIARKLARELDVNGLMNVQMAIKQGGERPGSESRATQDEDQIYILEVNPRASRTAPFVGKATHVQWPRIAAKVMMGKTLSEMNVREIKDEELGAYAVKESVFPFSKFPGVDVVLGPEMRSTGEVMGIDQNLAVAFGKSQLAAGTALPRAGNVFISVRERDRLSILEAARILVELGFGVYATGGTGEFLKERGVPAVILQRIGAGARPNVIDMMQDGKIQLVINTPTKTGWQTDEGRIRAATVRLGVPMITTTTGALAAARAIGAMRHGDWGVKAMQDYRRDAEKPRVEVKGPARERV